MSGSGRIRTDDQGIMSPLLSPLSYTPFQHRPQAPTVGYAPVLRIDTRRSKNETRRRVTGGILADPGAVMQTPASLTAGWKLVEATGVEPVSPTPSGLPSTTIVRCAQHRTTQPDLGQATQPNHRRPPHVRWRTLSCDSAQAPIPQSAEGTFRRALLPGRTKAAQATRAARSVEPKAPRMTLAALEARVTILLPSVCASGFYSGQPINHWLRENIPESDRNQNAPIENRIARIGLEPMTSWL